MYGSVGTTNVRAGKKTAYVCALEVQAEIGEIGDGFEERLLGEKIIRIIPGLGGCEARRLGRRHGAKPPASPTFVALP